MDIEKVTKVLERMQRDVGLYVRRANTGGTAEFRLKTTQLRSSIQKTENELQSALQNAPAPGVDRSWDQIRNSSRETKKDFEQADTNERRREKMFPLGSSGGDAAGVYASGNSARGGQIELSQLQRVDMSELATEEAIQLEKHRAAREIEQETGELHGAYVEFNALTKEQQKGLDTMTTNVTKAHSHVERGVGELKEASKHQKSSRKMICIIVVILVVVIAIVVVVVVVMKK